LAPVSLALEERSLKTKVHTPSLEKSWWQIWPFVPGYSHHHSKPWWQNWHSLGSSAREQNCIWQHADTWPLVQQ